MKRKMILGEKSREEDETRWDEEAQSTKEQRIYEQKT